MWSFSAVKRGCMKMKCVTVSFSTTSLYNRVFPYIAYRCMNREDGLTHIEIKS